MAICTQTPAQTSVAGISKRGNYKVKKENIIKLKIYLAKNERKFKL